jgi:hypothetical protein
MNDFGWALAQMRAGNRVRRTGWLTVEWIAIVNGAIVDEDGKVTVFTNQKPLLALDWVLA